MDIVSVNYHIIKACDSTCSFCFATFRDVGSGLKLPDSERLIRMLADAGAEKITFAGGEPTLHRGLGAMLRCAKDAGLTTSIVTNGFQLERVLREASGFIDWVGISVDSADETVQRRLGRGQGDHVHRSMRLAELCRGAGIRLKLNTVVTTLNWEEDMSEYLRAFRPERWKVFQVLPVEGQNDGSVEDLLISSEQFQAFVNRHESLKTDGLGPIPESNESMTDSYAMIDPLGRFYGDTDFKHRVSPPILEVGVLRALQSVGFVPEKLIERGGVYDWRADAALRTSGVVAVV